MAEKVVGLRIEISGTKAQQKELGKLTLAQKELQAQNKALLKQADELTKAKKTETEAFKEVTSKIGKNKAALLDVGNSTKKVKRSIDLNNKSLRASSGSYNELVANTNKLRKRLKELPNAFDKNNQAAKKLQAQIKGNTDKLKEFDQGIGDNFRNVGNYKEGMLQAVDASGLFSTQLGVLRQIQAVLNPLIKTATANTNAQAAAQTKANFATRTGVKALKAFKLALAATGIGALLVALGSLFSFFTKTERGAESVERGVAGISAAFDVLIDRLSGTGEALSLIFSGEFSKGLDLLREQFKGITEEIKNEAQAAVELERRFQELEDAQRDFRLEEAKLNVEIKRGEAAVNDESVALEDRLELIKRSIKLNKQLADERIRLAKEDVAIIQERINLGETLDEELDELVDAQVNLINVEETELNTQKRLISALKTLERQIIKRAKAAKKAREAEEKEAAQALTNLEKEVSLIRKISEEQKKRQAATEKSFNDLLRLEEELDEAEGERLLDKEKRELDSAQRIADGKGEIEGTAREAAIEGAFQLAQTISDGLFQLEREAQQRRTEEAIRAAQDRANTEQTILEEQLRDGIISETDYREKKHALDVKAQREERRIRKQAFEEQKTLAIIQATINTAMAVINAYAQAGNPILGAVFAGIAAAVGVAQIAIIASQQFAKGGVLPAAKGGMIEGNSHANGGVKFAVGGVPHEAEGGEAIINKKSTKMYGGLLSAINQAGGGVAFAKGGVVKAQRGISLPPPSQAFNQGVIQDQAAMSDERVGAIIAERVNDKRVVVVEEDITETQDEVSINAELVEF